MNRATSNPNSGSAARTPALTCPDPVDPEDEGTVGRQATRHVLEGSAGPRHIAHDTVARDEIEVAAREPIESRRRKVGHDEPDVAPIPLALLVLARQRKRAGAEIDGDDLGVGEAAAVGECFGAGAAPGDEHASGRDVGLSRLPVRPNPLHRREAPDGCARILAWIRKRFVGRANTRGLCGGSLSLTAASRRQACPSRHTA